MGYDLYLWYFTLYKLKTLKFDKNENDFFYFLKLIPKQGIALDIGANIGLMSYYMAKSIDKVYAFEPMPNNFNVIEKLISRFSLNNLSLQKCALGKTSGIIKLVLPIVEGVKKQGLSHVVADKMTEFNEGIEFETDCFRLDEINTFKNTKVSAIKIDVENFEFEVFQGAEELLVRDKPIIYCELWDNKNREDCFNYLSKLGYSINIYTKGGLTEINSNPNNVQNFFFIPKQA